VSQPQGRFQAQVHIDCNLEAVYGKKDVSLHEFDLVINCDYLGSPGCVADIVERAFREKFPGKLK
jgi:hypothetical protein